MISFIEELSLRGSLRSSEGELKLDNLIVTAKRERQELVIIYHRSYRSDMSYTTYSFQSLWGG